MKNINFARRTRMIFVSTSLFSLALMLMVSCKEEDIDDSNNLVDNPGTSGLTPVETRPKVAPNQSPAFAGQTRVPGVKTSFNINVSTIATGLNRPWGIDFLPDNRIIVSERPGTIRIVSNSGVLGNPINGIPTVRAEGDGGLLDLKLDPDFATTRYVFWAYSEPVPGGSINSIARGRLSANETNFENVTVIYRGTTPHSGPNHNGSRLLFDDQGRLYASFGERFENSVRIQAQQLNSSLGKIIRINKDGSAAAGNPFITTSGALPEIWSYGHRNPQGLAFNPVTGELWSDEHGPQAGDEINIIGPGKNYGWPIIAYGLEYDGSPVNGTGITQQNGMEQPIYYWDPTVAPSGMTFYTGSQIPEWQNNLFIGTLAGSHIIRLVIDNVNHRIIGEERLLENENRRIRQVAQGKDGALYAITDEPDGRIYRISN